MTFRKALAAAFAVGMAKVCLVSLLLIASPAAEAGIYKCKLGATTTYQEQPCEKHAVSERLDEGSGEASLAGCFLMVGGSQDDYFKVAATAPGKYVMYLVKGEKPVPLLDATPADIRVLSDAFHIHFLRGLKFDVGTTKETKPVGIYAIKDKEGDESLFGYFFLGNGLLRRTACR